LKIFLGDLKIFLGDLNRVLRTFWIVLAFLEKGA
jgi:hypothetical protein